MSIYDEICHNCNQRLTGLRFVILSYENHMYDMTELGSFLWKVFRDTGFKPDNLQ